MLVAITDRKPSIDNTKAHTQAMKMLEEAGIYVFTVSLPIFSYFSTNDLLSVIQTISTSRCCISRPTPYKSYNAGNM